MLFGFDCFFFHSRIKQRVGVDAFTSLAVHVNLLSKKFDAFGVNVMQSPMVTFDFCGDNHANGQCLEIAQYVGNFHRQQNNLNSNFYHSRLRNHPNFSWNNNQSPSSKLMYLPGFSSLPPVPREKKLAIEEILAHYMKKTEALLQSNQLFCKVKMLYYGLLRHKLGN